MLSWLSKCNPPSTIKDCPVIYSDSLLVRNLMNAAIGAKGWEDTVPYAILVLTDSRHYKPFIQHVIMYQDVVDTDQQVLHLKIQDQIM